MRGLLGSLAILLLYSSSASVEGAVSHSEGDGGLFAPSNAWRVVNLRRVTYGWSVGELKLFTDTHCREELAAGIVMDGSVSLDSSGRGPSVIGTAIASGHWDTPPTRAFDGEIWTEWHAQCHVCEPGEAWVGLRFSAPVSVYCMQIYQWGSRDYMASETLLERWEEPASGNRAGEWQGVLRGSQLGGDRWEQIYFTQCPAPDPPAHGRVAITNRGFHPSVATYQCSGARILGGSGQQECLSDGTWSGGAPRCWAAIEIVILATAVVALEVAAAALYYYFVVKSKPPPLEARTFIPEEYLGKWSTHEIWGIREKLTEEEAEGDAEKPKSLLLPVLLCPCCRIAETWRSAGEIPYKVGVWLAQCLLPVLPCLAGFFRLQMRKRFNIKGSILRDVFLWTCCIPCIIHQEAKHVDTLCDLAAEEAEVMRQNEQRRRDREQAAQHALDAAKLSHGGRSEGATKIGHTSDERATVSHFPPSRSKTGTASASVLDRDF